jgi:hypothetical protein
MILTHGRSFPNFILTHVYFSCTELKSWIEHIYIYVINNHQTHLCQKNQDLYLYKKVGLGQCSPGNGSRSPPLGFFFLHVLV